LIRFYIAAWEAWATAFGWQSVIVGGSDGRFRTAYYWAPKELEELFK